MLTSAQVKAEARKLGFDLCGIARARALDRAPFEAWLANGWHAALSYMRERLDERVDPRVLLPGAQSVIVVAASYGPTQPEPALPDGELLVARYARNRDYHNVLLKKARKLAAWLRRAGGEAYCAVDTGAVAEKPWAQEAGLGWIGRNGLLIHQEFGSWLLLGALVTTHVLDPDAPHPERCGDCRACIPACPTDAIRDGRFIDSRACIAFHTIEHRDPLPREIAKAQGPRVFGCDLCQDVCPWNRKARPGTLVQLRARREQTSLPIADVLTLTEASCSERFQGTPLMRTGREGLVRTALGVVELSNTPSLRPIVEALTTDTSEAIRAEAQRVLQTEN